MNVNVNVKKILKTLPNLKRPRKTEQKQLVQQAEEARNEGRFGRAAELYEEALRSGRATKGMLLQAGHMHKEARNFREAEARYAAAHGMDPQDAEILLQLGHFYKTVGRYEEALLHYQRASAMRPDWDAARDEMLSLTKRHELERERFRKEFARESQDLTTKEAKRLGRFNALLDESLVPKSLSSFLDEHKPAYIPTYNGRDEITEWGRGLTVRGITSMRGFIVSDVPYRHIEIFVDGKRVYKGDMVSAPQPWEKSDRDVRKYCYNAWIDFSDFEPGWHEFTFRAVNMNGDSREGVDWRREPIIIAPPFEEKYFGESDGYIPPVDKDSPLSLAEQINARPSMVHKCTTRSFPFHPKNVAVLRPDQLGDMVASVPALMRLREILPDARITGLLSAANEGLARTLNVFDEIIVLDFPDDPIRQERLMPLEDQEKLARQLQAYEFDLVLDLPICGNSSKLLPLIGAPFNMGFCGPRKTFDVSFITYDPTTGVDFVKHSARTRILTEALALSFDSGARIMRRDDISREALEKYGVPAEDPYIVIHAGSRIKFSQWPHYTDLAEKIVREMGVRVVFMGENEEQKTKLPKELIESGQIVFMAGKMPYDDFDAFLSYASVFIGNDSGPKHLASLRGTQVVSIHSSRTAWEEWGNPLTGVAISRKVPCAGCSYHHNYEECARDVICIKGIKVEEVFREVKTLFEAPLAYDPA